jgi:hypothetical protein
MVEHKCRRCGHVFYRKSSYDSHLKTDCINKPRVFRIKEYKCGTCDLVFTRSDNLAVHAKSCREKQNNRPQIVVENGEVNNMNNIANNNGNIVNNAVRNDVQNAVINNQENIIITNILLPYTKHLDLLHMNKEELDHIFNSDQNPYVVYFELVHCNPDRPMYHNLYYENDKKIRVFTQGGWVEQDSNTIMEYILTEEHNSIINYLDIMQFFMNNIEFNNISNIVTSLQFHKKSSSEIWKKVTDELIYTKEQMSESLKKHKPIYAPTFDKIKQICLNKQFEKNKSSLHRRNTIREIKSSMNFYKEISNKNSHSGSSDNGTDSTDIDSDMDSKEVINPNKKIFNKTTEESYDDKSYDEESYDEESYNDVIFSESSDESDNESHRSTKNPILGKDHKFPTKSSKKK